jgi:hypothetical protein
MIARLVGLEVRLFTKQCNHYSGDTHWWSGGRGDQGLRMSSIILDDEAVCIAYERSFGLR